MIFLALNSWTFGKRKTYIIYTNLSQGFISNDSLKQQELKEKQHPDFEIYFFRNFGTCYENIASSRSVTLMDRLLAFNIEQIWVN